jgi:hypothetical protein
MRRGIRSVDSPARSGRDAVAVASVMRRTGVTAHEPSGVARWTCQWYVPGVSYQRPAGKS